MRMTKEQNTNKGITLIALVITIIVMLILVAVTITMAVNGGLFDYARKAGQETNKALQDEQQLAGGKVEVDGLWYETIDDYIANEPMPTREDFFEMVDEDTGEITIALFDYSENHNGIGYYYNDDDEKILSEEIVVIPSKINNVDVKIIRGKYYENSGGFYNASNLKTVVIPDTVEEIEEYAFYNCTSLEKVVLSEGLEIIGEDAFRECTSLKEITIPRTVTSFGYAFRNCTSLEKVMISEGVEVIYSYTFESCTSLTEITIPSSVTYISDSAFEGCTNLTKITLAKGSPLSVEDGPWGAENATVVKEQ